MSSQPGIPPHHGPETSRISVPHEGHGHPAVRTGAPVSDDEARMIAALRPGTALLLVPSGPVAGARYLLDEELTTVGRAPDADIVLDDVTVSRKHARFVRSESGDFRLEDSGSTNGTYVNDEPVEGADLREGDVVQIGKYRLTYHPAVQHPA